MRIGILWAVTSVMLLGCTAGPQMTKRDIKPPVSNDSAAGQVSTLWPTLTGEPPLVIAHRGASGYLPEHTLAAYDLAIDLGADYIEPDLVITQDGVLVARHDRYLSSTTDVGTRPEFSERQTVKPGYDTPDWFVDDFTLAELKTLRAVQPRAGRSNAYDGDYNIPTFDEVLALATERSRELGRTIGVYPETKRPSEFEAAGLSHDMALLKSLEAYGYNGIDAPVFIQSFEADNLKRLADKTDIKLIYLLADIPELSVEDIAVFASGIGPYKKMLLNEGQNSTGLIEMAHAAGLTVHPWTFRDDDLDKAIAASIEDEIAAYIRLGIDGYFSDFPDTALRARERFTPKANTLKPKE